MTITMKPTLLIFATLAICSPAFSQDDNLPKPELTEVWEPIPKLVTPSAKPGEPPSDAVVLFNGKNLDEWMSPKDGGAAKWTLSDGVITVKKGTGPIRTKRSFNDYQLHVEYRIPANITGSGQARGNSGIFLAAASPNGDSGYEIQVLDGHNNKTYVNGQVASVYKQHIPLANASKKPGEWQTYDIIWTAPRFNDDGTLKTAARVTVIHNGVLVQNNVEIKGETTYRGQPSYKKHGPAPILLQDHGDPSEPISYRNIWLREL
jgi:hypothetical protein